MDSSSHENSIRSQSQDLTEGAVYSGVKNGQNNAKKARRKHKNSKVGCLQCKQRRMKCNEELPECKNCRIRQVKIPCSYLSFTAEEKEEFRRKKKENENNDRYAKYSINESLSESISESISESPDSSSPVGFKLPLVAHVKNSTLKSQHHCFYDEPRISLGGRLYFVKLINDSFFNWQALSGHLTLSAAWLHSQLSKKFNALSKNNLLNDDETEEYQTDLDILQTISARYKSKCLIHLRDKILDIMNFQNLKDYGKALKAYADISIPTYTLQCADIVTQENLKLYYINGSMMVLKEFYTSTADSSPLASFIAQSSFTTQRALFIPTYSFEILYEVFGVIQELKPFITKTNDVYLIDRYYALLDFLKNDLLNSDIKENYNKNYIIPYPPSQLYKIFYRFFKIMPSQMFTMDTTTSPIHLIFYSFFYTLSRILDNIFPETRYITQFRFIGPTCMYPYDERVFYKSIPPELVRFGRYSMRVMAFFTRRSEFFWKYMKVLNPFPEHLDSHRFRSRKARIEESFVDKFRSTVLERRHYPQVLSRQDNHQSDNYKQNEGSASPASSTDSFSTNFNTIFALDLDFSSELSKMSFDINNELVQFDGSLDEFELGESWLLKSDYDPLIDDWTAERSPLNADKMSLRKYMEDREILMRNFIYKTEYS